MLRELVNDEFLPNNICCSFVATAIIGAGAIGAGASIYSANKAAGAQEAAANNATSAAENQFNITQQNLQPYNQAGQSSTATLQSLLPTLTAPITMDEATLRNTPGYQFNLTQGLKSTQNSAAARGLGVSGAALKGASTFATGLADNTYQNQFNNANTNQTNAYNRLMGVINTGESAAAGVGSASTATGQTVAGTTIAGGNAAAAGANATGTAVQNLGNNVSTYALIKGLYGTGSATDANTISQLGGQSGTDANGNPLVNP